MSHPLALAAAGAVLRHLKQSGPDLQCRLNEKTAEFVATLNAYAEQVEAPIRLTHFSSWFCIHLPQELPMSGLFYLYMREKGVHVWKDAPASLPLLIRTRIWNWSSRRLKKASRRCKSGFFSWTPRCGGSSKEKGPPRRTRNRIQRALDRSPTRALASGTDGRGGFTCLRQFYHGKYAGPFRTKAMVKAIQELVHATIHSGARSAKMEMNNI